MIGDLAFITWAHHGLIQGNRRAAIYGTIITIIFAVLFTGLQYFEYKEAGFTFADSVFGSAFFASTGLHGLIMLAPTKINNLNLVYVRKIHSSFSNKEVFQLMNKSNNRQVTNLSKIDRSFLEWLTGFVDAEGNFNISLRNYNIKNNQYNSLILTFQIGLHIDDLEVLNFIKFNLGCGKITVSKNRCNFFVNDQTSLINIICPIFNLVLLKSSKLNQFLIFEKAIDLIRTKSHLTDRGKKSIIKYYLKIKNTNSYLNDLSLLSWDRVEKNYPIGYINKYWLGGFVDGEGSFSARLNRPVFKFENDIKEMVLFKALITYFKVGQIIIAKPRNKGSQMISIEYNNIHFLKNIVLPIFTETKLLKSKKGLDFKDFCTLVNIYYYGYHNLVEGKSLAREIISNWNNFRLSTNKYKIIDLNKKTELDNPLTFIHTLQKSTVQEKYEILSKIPSPYVIKEGGIRYYRNTSNLVSDKIKIIAIDLSNNESIFSSISECSRTLQIGRAYIKKALLKGNLYKNYRFKFHNFIV
jgi:hypothetical protein